MDQIAVFIDNAAHARRIIEPMLRRDADDAGWIVVACPPRLTRHAGRWVSHAGRQQMQRKWLQDLRGAIEPMFSQQTPGSVRWLLASEALERISSRLRAQHGTALRLLDARAPRLGRACEPLAADLPAEAGEQWQARVAVSSGVALMLALAD